MKAPFQDGLFGSRRKSKFAERLQRIGSGSSLGDDGPATPETGQSVTRLHAEVSQGSVLVPEGKDLRERAERRLDALRKQSTGQQFGNPETVDPHPQTAPSRSEKARSVTTHTTTLLDAPGQAEAQQPLNRAGRAQVSLGSASPAKETRIGIEKSAGRATPNDLAAKSSTISATKIARATNSEPQSEAKPEPEPPKPSLSDRSSLPEKPDTQIANTQKSSVHRSARLSGAADRLRSSTTNSETRSQARPVSIQAEPGQQNASKLPEPGDDPTPLPPVTVAEIGNVHEQTGQTIIERSATPLEKVAPLSKALSSVQSLRKHLAAAGSSTGASSDSDRVLEEAPVKAVYAACRSSLWPVAIFSFVINLLMLTGPLFMLQVYDRALPSGSVPTLVLLFVLVSVLYAFFALLESIRGRVFIRLGTRIDEILHKPLYRTTLDIGAQNNAAVGSNPLRDLDSIRTYVSGPGPAAFFDVPWVPVYIGLIFVLHPLLGFFATFAAILLVAIAVINKKSTHEGHAEAAQATEVAQRFAEDGRRQASAAQALGMSDTLINQWAALKAESRRLISAVTDRTGLFGSMSKSMRLYFQSAMLGLGAWLAIEQAITAGMIIAATIIMSRALAPIEQIVQQWSMFAGAQRSWSRIKQLFEKVPAKKPRSTKLPMPSGAVQVAGLTCLIDGSRTPVISGINFELEPGAGLGIIGPSGAGKSTLIKSLLGIWPSVRGDVRLDGATHDQWDRDELGRNLGYLPQGVTLFPGTIAQNISRFEENPSSDSVLEAARVSGVHGLAVSLEDGYDTRVGPGGVQLSAGQVQRIALARAVYKMPALVVLDEPYSNLDADGEQALTESIKTLRANGSTVIVVAHRASALNALDTVLCLKDGAQAFYGPKEEVLRAMTQAVNTNDGQQKQIADKRAKRPIVRQVK